VHSCGDFHEKITKKLRLFFSDTIVMLFNQKQLSLLELIYPFSIKKYLIFIHQKDVKRSVACKNFHADYKYLSYILDAFISIGPREKESLNDFALPRSSCAFTGETDNSPRIE